MMMMYKCSRHKFSQNKTACHINDVLELNSTELSTPETLGNSTDACISCRHWALTLSLAYLRRTATHGVNRCKKKIKQNRTLFACEF